MTASCTNNETDKTIKLPIWGEEKVENIAYAMALIDLSMVVLYWIALIFAKEMLTISENYVRSDTLTGADFTLRVKMDPYLDHTGDIR